MLAQVELDSRAIKKVELRFVRHNECNETLLTAPQDEVAALARLAESSARCGARLEAAGGAVTVLPVL
jgi:hypothetical protein